MKLVVGYLDPANLDHAKSILASRHDCTTDNCVNFACASFRYLN